jgi:DNA-binding SARP family transcriptional activator/tetratricopeptide (TPR) repeat protein
VDSGLRIQILGRVRVSRDGRGVPLGDTAQRAILGLLVLAGGQPLSRADLTDALWGEAPPASAANIIQTHVKHLRRLLEPDRPARAPSVLLPRVGDGYALQVAAEQVDLASFRKLVAAAAGGREPTPVVTLLGQALRLWDGPPLADVPVLAAHPRRITLVRERRAAVARWSDAMIAAGAAAEAVPILEELAATEPLDEATKARLVRAYHAAGQRARALGVYHETRRQLADELGLDPGAELTAAHAALLAGERPAERPAEPGRIRDRPVPALLPAEARDFTGRAAELAELDRAAGGAAVCVVSGTAGVGKTALAVSWAHRAKARFPDGQLYVDLRGYDRAQPMTRGEALDRLLAALGVSDQEIPLDIEDRAGRYRTEVADRRLLVLLDNAGSADQVRPLLPGTRSCAVVVTSRDSLAGLVALDGARRLELAPLRPGDAVGLLRTLIGARAEADPASTAVLADRCARLPLALRIAAERVTGRPAAPLAELVADLADHQRRLEVLDAGGDDRAAVRTVFSWSYDRLPAEPAAAFRLLGLHPGPDFDTPAVAALADTDLAGARRWLDTLVRAHLVQPTGPDRYGMHDLLRGYAAELARDQDGAAAVAAALTRLLDHYLAAVAAAMDLLYAADRHHRPRVDPPATPVPALPDADAARAWLDAHRGLLVDVCAHAATRGWPAHAVRLSGLLFRYLEGGHSLDALVVHQHALTAARATGDRAGAAHALTDLGVAQRLLGRYGPAGEHLRRAVALHRETGERVGEARALSNLGIVDERLGDNDAAIDHHERALLLYRQAGDRHGEASTLNNLASVYPTLGGYDAAAEHYRQALARYREIGDRMGEGTVLSNFGKVEADLDRHDTAIEAYQQALSIFRDLGHHYGEAAVLNNLGDTEALLGRYGTAVEHQRRALSIFRDLGHRYGEVCGLNSLGEALLAAGRPAEALAQHRAALAISTETGDRDEQARAYDGLGRASQASGDPAAARAHWQDALARYAALGSPAAARVRARLSTLDQPAAG